jgi:hypothetical protein
MSAKVRVMDAGHRERKALLGVWDSEPWKCPFWKWLEDVMYDPDRDEFIWPDGRVVTVQEAMQRGTGREP